MKLTSKIIKQNVGMDILTKRVHGSRKQFEDYYRIRIEEEKHPLLKEDSPVSMCITETEESGQLSLLGKQFNIEKVTNKNLICYSFFAGSKVEVKVAIEELEIVNIKPLK